MARLAGASGVVVGIDPEERLLAQARDEAARQGLDVEFRRGDVAELEETVAFDLVHTRFLLSQRSRSEAEAALKRMMRVVQPGGTIVVEDFECPPDPDGQAVGHPAYTRLLELFHALVRDEETDPPSGLQLPALLEHAGVAGVHIDASPTPASTGEGSRNPAAQVLSSIRHAIVAANLATRTEVDRLASELDRFRTTPQSLFWLPRIVQVWGSVPTAGSGL
jgi:SAM-dependent methyltransferase